MTDLTLYEILGVAKDATTDEITAAYRQLGKRHHPDRNPGDEVAAAHYARVSEAYTVLGDPARRADYDRAGTTRAPDHRQEIMAILVPIMLQAIQTADPFVPVTRKDLVAVMRTRVRVTLDDIERARTETVAGRRVLEQVVGRFTSDGDDNPLDQAVRAQLARALEIEQVITRDLDRYHRALKYLDTVKYRRDDPFGPGAWADGGATTAVVTLDQVLDTFHGRKPPRPKALPAADTEGDGSP